jgi:uncharacterized membrane protein YcgQ (UPF0703/DUF1980 family)
MDEKVFMKYSLFLLIAGFAGLLLLWVFASPYEVSESQIPQDNLVSFSGIITNIKDTPAGTMISIERSCVDSVFVKAKNISFQKDMRVDVVGRKSQDFFEAKSIHSSE